MKENTFDVVEPTLRVYDEKTMQPVPIDWHKAVDVMLGLMVQHDNPAQIVVNTQSELHRLADAYMLALGWMELLKSQRDDAREAYEAARNALNDLPLHEQDRAPHLEYHDPDDVARVMQMMHQQIIEWHPPVN